MEIVCPSCEAPIEVRMELKIKRERPRELNRYLLKNPVYLPPLNATDPAYVIKDTLGLIIACYKAQSGFNPADRKWDQANYARFKLVAKTFLAFFDNSYPEAKEALIDISEEFKKKGLAWTLETVLKYAPTWRKQNAPA